MSMFENEAHRELTYRIAAEYESRVRRRDGFYTPVAFGKLPEDCQLEHAGIALAAMRGGLYLGSELPGWVVSLV